MFEVLRIFTGDDEVLRGKAVTEGIEAGCSFAFGGLRSG
jgi:hypothetical protein